MKPQFFIMASLIFVFVFGVNYYLTNVEKAQQRLKNISDDLDQYARRYNKKCVYN